MRIGAHVGVGKGWVEAVRYCADVGAECLQVFSKSPRMWRASPLPDQAHGPFARAMNEYDVTPAFVHTSYLVNLGSEDPVLRARSIGALAEEFRRAGAVGAAGLVTHVGTNPFGDSSRAAEWIADAVYAARNLTDSTGRSTRLLLENSAGAGRHYGATAEQIGSLLCSIEDRDAGPAGVCLDTCHAFAAGYDLSSENAWGDVLDALEAAGGPASLRLVHANDCLFGRGERRDRHAWIGDGQMGESAFRAMFRMERLAGAPIIIEMPGDVPEKETVNIERLKRFRSESETFGTDAKVTSVGTR